ncbi:MAG TPA: bacteriohemerythrin [Candidatus Krumholzibacteria bacterium]|nr:bacteriohemerythrin [Candidatus Krumholzibacteria bacterium]
MATPTWSDSYSVGVESIDAQHRHLFEVAARLAEAIEAHRSQRVMAGIMKDLIAYTRSHFVFEEMMMEQAGYPDLKRHRAQHAQLLRKVERFRGELEGEGRRVGPEVHRFLQSWLVHHIIEDDLAYAPVLQAAPVEP